MMNDKSENSVKLSAFADEVSPDFRAQVEFLVSEDIRFIEIRFVNGKNIIDLTSSELVETRRMLDNNGIGVSAIGSPIGKVRIDAPFMVHLDKFRHVVELAEYFEAPFIRAFSYYPPEGEQIDNYREEVIDRMHKKTALLHNSNAVIVLENETGIYGYSAENSVDLVRAVGSPKLKLAYDPANFVWGQGIKNNMEICWPSMQPYVAHVHIKDWKLGSKDVGIMPGEGDGQIRELLAALISMNYRGFITLEPHLKHGGQFGGDTGPELFSEAVAVTRQLCKETKIELI